MQNNSFVFILMFRRAASFLYDCLLLVAVFFIITAIAIVFNDGQAIQNPAYYFFLYLIAFIFFDWFWRHGGQTLGMRAWRIRVETQDGQMITRMQSFQRYLTGSLLFGITLLCMPFTDKSDALHDKLSKTRIVLHYK